MLDNYWISTQKLALIKGVSARAVRKAISKNNYQVRKNGRNYEILVSTLDSATQDLINSKNQIEKFIPNGLCISESAKDIALAKFDLVYKYRDFVKSGKNKCEATNDFLQIYNSQLQYSEIYSKIGKVGKSTLYRWDKKLRENKDNWEALVCTYPMQKSGSKLSSAEEEIFMSLLLHSNKTNIGKAITLTKHILKERGITEFSCDMSFRRFAEQYKREHYDVWIFAREGTKALRDKVVPYIERNISQLEVGDVIIGDGHKLAFQVINPFTGKPCRPTLAAYQDWKSGALVGFEIMIEENTQSIASALRNSIINLGKIPKYIYQDNGKAYKSKYFTETDGIVGLFVKLGIQPIFAKPYNAKAKPIERLFREMQDCFERLLPSFVGSCIDDRPAYLKRNEKFHKEHHNEYIPTIEEVIQLLNKWLGLHYSKPCKAVKGKTIGEVLEAGRGSGVDIDKLDDLMMATEIKRIGRNGIRFLKADYYDESLYGLRTTVVIKYSLFDLSHIKVYLTNGKFLCIATRMESLNPLANYTDNVKDIEDLKQRIKQQQRLEHQTIKAYLSEFKKENGCLPTFDEPDYEEYQSIKERTQDYPLLEDKKSSKKIFKNNYERYEFLKQKEDLSPEESAWVSEYETTDEYTLIYKND